MVEFLIVHRETCFEKSVVAGQAALLLLGSLGLFAKAACQQLLIEGTARGLISQVGKKRQQQS